MPTFYSQAGQDRLAYALLVEPTDKHNGSFLDIGANHPVKLSNTYMLEELGWRGLLVDCDAYCLDLLRTQRKSPVLAADATNCDWKKTLTDAGLWPTIDYLTLDCDENSAKALAGLPLGELAFSLITIEHDAYRFGNGLRDQERAVLHSAGYDLLCADVHSNRCCFEDWWVKPDRIDMVRAERYRSIAQAWTFVLGLRDVSGTV